MYKPAIVPYTEGSLQGSEAVRSARNFLCSPVNPSLSCYRRRGGAVLSANQKAPHGNCIEINIGKEPISITLVN